MEISSSKVTLTGEHCGKCIYFRDTGRCGNPRQENRMRGYFEVACGQYEEGSADPIPNGATLARVPAGHLRCRYCGVVLPANEMARGPYGFIRVCKPCKQEMSRRAGKAQRKSKNISKRP